MNKQNGALALILPIPLILSLLGVAFCIWNAWGNTISFCDSPGCNISHSIDIAGISMWWFGCIAFGGLCLLSLSGYWQVGAFIAGLCIFFDIWLLLLMAFTSPCINCLIVALLFAIIFYAFSKASNSKLGLCKYLLLVIWSLLFLINLILIARVTMGTWSIYTPQKTNISLYFSPSCPSCKKAIYGFANADNVAFYPIAEDDTDIMTIAHMQNFIQQGETITKAFELATVAQKKLQDEYNSTMGSIENVNKTKQEQATNQSSKILTDQEAMQQVQIAKIKVIIPERISLEKPQNYTLLDMLLLHFRLLCNKAHVLNTGSSTIPFIEYHGLPSSIANTAEQYENNNSQYNINNSTYQNINNHDQPIQEINEYSQDFPIDTEIAGSCEGGEITPCPE